MENNLKQTQDWLQKKNENQQQEYEFNQKQASDEDISMFNTRMVPNRRGRCSGYKIIVIPKHTIENVSPLTTIFINETYNMFQYLTNRISELETEVKNLKEQ